MIFNIYLLFWILFFVYYLGIIIDGDEKPDYLLKETFISIIFSKR